MRVVAKPVEGCQSGREERVLREEIDVFCAEESWGVCKRKRRMRRAGGKREDVESPDARRVENRKRLRRREDFGTFLRHSAVQCASSQ